MTKFESIFENIKNRNIIYCIEASASTYSLLPKIKKHIIETLFDNVEDGEARQFNIICFNSSVSKWCTTMVPVNGALIAAAEEWLRDTKAVGTCNLLGALASALRVPEVGSVCVVTTQLPDQEVQEVLDTWAYIGHRVPVHVRLCLLGEEMQEGWQTAPSTEAYIAVAEETGGTFAVVRVGQGDRLEIVRSSRNRLAGTGSSVLVGHSAAESPMVPCSDRHQYPHHSLFNYWKRVSSSKPYMRFMKDLHDTNAANATSDHVSLIGSSLILGRKVLARRYNDAQYYVGTVKERVDTDVFKVAFGLYDIVGGDFSAMDYQDTKLFDLIDIDAIWKRRVLPGDRVLAPDPTASQEGSKSLRYLAGTVLDGYDYRNSSTLKATDGESDQKSSKSFIIEFTHPINKTAKVRSDQAVCIPESLFQRLCLEGAMPRMAREDLYKVKNYPESSLDGYPTSGTKRFPADYTFTNVRVLKGTNVQVDYLRPPFCLPIYPLVDVIEKEGPHRNQEVRTAWNTINEQYGEPYKENVPVPDSDYSIKELTKKVSEQLDRYKHVSETAAEAVGYVTDHGIPLRSKDTHTKKGPTKNQKSTLNQRSSSPKPLSSSQTDKRSTQRPISWQGAGTSSLSAKVEFNEKSQDPLRPGEPASKTISLITDLGERDKGREKYDQMKLRQRSEKVDRRLQSEKERFCMEERRHDAVEQYRRELRNYRINEANMRRERDDGVIASSQAFKREVVADVEGKVEQTPSWPVKPVTFEEIDQKRVEFMKRKNEVRENDKLRRNEDALRYIEKLEENKKNRCDRRWWSAQNQMLKEYPEKA